ncbi:MAG: hypothetical protein IIB90_13045 [Gemmatimonadetes bacterium]|nr:hypothetical protein [Gemmatimonadota bacterium]
MRKSVAGRDGFVLPVVIFTIVIMGVMAVAALRTSADGHLASQAMRVSGGAFYSAEAGLYRVLGQLADTTNTLDSSVQALAVGDSLLLPQGTLTNGASYLPRIVRLSSGVQPMYLLAVTGRGPGAVRGKRRLRMVFTSSVDVSAFAPAAMHLDGVMEIVGNPTSTINGNDTPPPGWVCDPPGPALPGVVMADTSDINLGSGTILGSPPIDEDPSLGASSFTTFGGVTYASMAAMADKVYWSDAVVVDLGPVFKEGGTVCDTSRTKNWGDPLDRSSACGNYFPIIHFKDDVHFDDHGSVGQGILLVDGRFDIDNSDFTFYGLIIVRGNESCDFEHEVTVYGAVHCAKDGGQIHQDAVINYSSCALADALTYSGVLTETFGPLKRIGSRAWSEF